MGRRTGEGKKTRSKSSPAGGARPKAKSRPKRAAGPRGDLSPSMKLAISVLRIFTDPEGVPVAELKELVDNRARGFFNYKKRLEAVFHQFLSYQVEIEEVRDKSGAKRLRLAAAGREHDQQALLFARLAAYDFVGSLLSGLGDAEVARQLESAEREFLTRLGPLASPFKRNLRRMFYVVPDAPKIYTDPAHVEVVNGLVRAFWSSRRVEMTYKAVGKPEAVHTIEPLTLALYRGALYLFARFQKKPEKTYLFALDRISRIELLKGEGAHFDYPREGEWSPGGFTEKSFGIFTPPKSKQEAIEVSLVFENVPWLKIHVRERQWIQNQRFVDLPDGRLRMQFTVNSLIEVLPWVKQWGTDVRVEGPRKLVEGMKGGGRG